ncbi:MAG: hypothetical protein ACJAYX_001172 [Planctomycetota bacterium]|jgi:hypothetical protein
MRIAATAATLLFALTACSTIEKKVSPYQQPNSLMSTEINQRIDQIPYQHREELVQNLLWLTQTGEQTIPALLTGLASENPKVRSSCCWVLGRLRDRRTVPQLQSLVADSETSVRMEACRTLVLMGDLQQSPKLIEGLDSDRKEVRYMCHEALKTATGHDFGYDHLNQNQQELRLSVLHWRQWWGEYAGDTFFASNYEQEHGLNNLAAPGGETKLSGAGVSPGQEGVDVIEPANQGATEGAVSPPVENDKDTTNGSAPATGDRASGNGGSANTGNTVSELPPSVPPTIPASVPPTIPPVKVETIEVLEVVSEQATTGTESVPEIAPGATNIGTVKPTTKPASVIEVPSATGGSANGGNGNGSETGGN